jgi:hypothetical protein
MATNASIIIIIIIIDCYAPLLLDLCLFDCFTCRVVSDTRLDFELSKDIVTLRKDGNLYQSKQWHFGVGFG